MKPEAAAVKLALLTEVEQDTSDIFADYPQPASRFSSFVDKASGEPAILLHDYWTVYDSPADLPFVRYTPRNIGNNNIV